MKRWIHFLGLAGIVLLLFGAVTFVLPLDESDIFSKVHLAAGGLSLLLFLFGGGKSILRGAAVKRAAGYSLGVTLYSTMFVGILVLLNLYVYENDPLHFDSTEQQVYTLAPQTKKVLETLEDEVVIRGFFVGGEVPSDVRDLLARFAKFSPKISYQIIDPEKDPRATERYGISERETLHFSFRDSESNREAKVVREIDEQSVINAISKLSRGGAKKVYWISGHGEPDLEDQTEAGFLFLKEAIEGENVEVNKLNISATAIPEDADALMLMAPRRALLEGERKAIAEYLKRGGNMLFLNEPNSTRDVLELVRPLGILVGQDIVLDQVVQLFSGPQIGVQPVISSYAEHPATEDFSQNVILSTASSVRAFDAARRYVTELAFTGPGSWAEDQVEEIFSENPTVELPQDSERGAVPIAAAYEGELRVGGLPLDSPNAEQDAEAESQYRGRVIVIGDSDFVANINIRQLFNRDFFLNSLNWILGSQERISISEKSLRTSTETLSPEQFRRIFLVCGVLLPELVLLWGLAVWWFRRS